MLMKIVSLNKFEQKEKSKIHFQRQLSAFLTIQKMLQRKEFVYKKLSFYSMLDSIDCE